MAGQAVEVGFALQQEGVLKVVPGGVDGRRVGRAGFHRGDDGGEARAGRNDVELFVVLKEYLEVFGQAQAEHGALSADEIARLIRRDDDDGLAVGAVNRADLLEDGEVWLTTISRSWERLTVRGVVAPSSPSARRQLGAVALSTI